MERYYTDLAVSFVRGSLGRADLDSRELFALGRRHGLRLHRFKRSELPRVRRVIGRALAETDPSDDAEGLYVKVEEGGRVVDRLKWIRHGFSSAVAASGSHWLERPILPNRLRDRTAIGPTRSPTASSSACSGGGRCRIPSKATRWSTGWTASKCEWPSRYALSYSSLRVLPGLK